MKKLIVILLIAVIYTAQSCHVRKKVQQSVVKNDSVHLKSLETEFKVQKKDSISNDVFSQYFRLNKDFELSAKKITKKVTETAPDNLRFVLNVDSLHPAGDSAIAIDKNTGTTAIIFKDSTGKVNVSIKPRGGRSEVYEVEGLKLRAKSRLDSGSVQAKNSTVTNSNASILNRFKDSTAVSLESSNKNNSTEKDFGPFKIIGLIVLLLIVLRLLVWLLRNQFPWVGWLNRLLGGK